MALGRPDDGQQTLTQAPDRYARGVCGNWRQRAKVLCSTLLGQNLSTTPPNFPFILQKHATQIPRICQVSSRISFRSNAFLFEMFRAFSAHCLMQTLTRHALLEHLPEHSSTVWRDSARCEALLPKQLPHVSPLPLRRGHVFEYHKT